jgi:hypothetical protein
VQQSGLNTCTAAPCQAPAAYLHKQTKAAPGEAATATNRPLVTVCSTPCIPNMALVHQIPCACTQCVDGYGRCHAAQPAAESRMPLCMYCRPHTQALQSHKCACNPNKAPSSCTPRHCVCHVMLCKMPKQHLHMSMTTLSSKSQTGCPSIAKPVQRGIQHWNTPQRL